MIVRVTEYEIKEAIVAWLNSKGTKVHIEYLPTQVAILPDKGTGYSATVEINT